MYEIFLYIIIVYSLKNLYLKIEVDLMANLLTIQPP